MKFENKINKIKSVNKYLLLLLVIAVFCTCSRYDLDDPAPISIPTFKTLVGGTGYDIATDVIELDDSYLIVGASGPRCDIVDAYALKIDKQNGEIIASNRYGDFNQGVEENLQSVVQHPSGKLFATGFTVQQDPDCTYGIHTDASFFMVELNEDLSLIKTKTRVSGDGEGWDAALSIETFEDTLYVVGQYWGIQAFMPFDDTLGFASNGFGLSAMAWPQSVGGLLDVIINNQKKAVFVGQTSDFNFKPLDIYFGIKELSSYNYLIDTFYRYPDREIAEGVAVVQIDDGTYRVAVRAYNRTADGERTDGQIVLLKLDTDGMNPQFIPIPIGELDEVNHMIKVEDGLVMAGTFSDDDLAGDFGIIKLGFDGTIIWKRNFDINQDAAKSIIKTRDEGFMVVGLSRNSDGINTMVIYKTDKEGLIQE